jgi:hypothetical protein
MHTAWAGAAVLLVVIGLWLVVSGGLQREVPRLVPLPEGPAAVSNLTMVAASQPVPMPGGNGHLETPAGQIR